MAYRLKDYLYNDSIVWMVESGAAAILLTAVLTALIPIILMIWIFWEIIKGIFRR